MAKRKADSGNAGAPPGTRIAPSREDYERVYYAGTTAPFYLERSFRDSGMPWFSHTHIGYEVGVVLSGSCIVNCAGKDYPASAGDAYYFDCLLPHGHNATGAAKVELLWAHVKPEALLTVSPLRGDLRLLRPFFALRGGESPVIGTSSLIAQGLGAACVAIQSAAEFGDLLAWRGIAASIVEVAANVGALAPTVSGSSDAPHKWEIVGQALAYLQEHFLTRFALAELAAHCNLSVSRFSSIFTETMHVSPMDYRNRLRIHHAAERVLKTSDKIAVIGEQCGFESQSQFSALFKRIVGFPPATLREKQAHGGRRDLTQANRSA